MRLFFATDLHGSEVCFRKFVSASSFYEADVLFLGGDLSGKSLVPIWRRPNGHWQTFDGERKLTFVSISEKNGFLREIADRGSYAYECDPEHYRAMTDNEKTAVLEELIKERVARWATFAEDKLRVNGPRIFAIPGNDDPPVIDGLLRGSRSFQFVDKKVAQLDSLQVLGFGGSTPTPWHTYREHPETDIRDHLEVLLRELEPKRPTIFHVHVPPFGTSIDLAPQLDEQFRPMMSSAGVVPISAGSIAVREAVLSAKPILGLFGHVHEARGTANLGRTLCVNPGSTYWLGRLLGFIADIEGAKLVNWQLTEG
jgi:uncharacterized protein